MYYTFFGLQQPPFRITPDTEFFFEGANRGSVLEALIYAIGQGEGIVKVTGEVGSGKTMLCRVLQQRLGDSVDIVYLANPNVSPEDILHAIAFELQLPVKREASRLEVMHALQQYLVQRHAERRQVVVFVEESQGMPLATLEEIRLLSNLETDRSKLLQIVLFGQPELDENLRQTSIRQLRERITHSFYLSPLSVEEVGAYLAFRLHAAGYRGPALFSRRVITYISKASGGLTRRVNIVADKALLAAFAESTHTISLKHVRIAVRDSEFSQGKAPPTFPLWSGWALLGLGAIVVGGGRLVVPRSRRRFLDRNTGKRYAAGIAARNRGGAHCRTGIERRHPGRNAGNVRSHDAARPRVEPPHGRNRHAYGDAGSASGNRGIAHCIGDQPAGAGARYRRRSTDIPTLGRRLPGTTLASDRDLAVDPVREDVHDPADGCGRRRIPQGLFQVSGQIN